MRKILSSLTLFLFISVGAFGQKTARKAVEQCGTMQRLERMFQKNPALKTSFESGKEQFARTVAQRKMNGSQLAAQRTYAYIPVVFHIVMPNPASVTDAQVQAQLAVLNAHFAGNNSDSTRIPAYFKSLYGKGSIQFCLAQRSPDGDVTTGITRVATSRTSFTTDDAMKHATTGGMDSWDTEKYFNVWITPLSDGVLGYATFPADGSPLEQGVVIDYRSLPGGSFASYNGGKSLVHEAGHFFFLFHIWGDDDGACTGSDDVGDTPNQAASTATCAVGIKTDACTPSGNGIMYQNYMDYSPDACLVMFTVGQATRMEAALTTYRSSLINANGCQAPVFKDYNAQLVSIAQPAQRICTPAFSPVINIRNRGSQTLTSLVIKVTVDGGTPINYNWSGSLAQSASTTVTLPSITVAEGIHSFVAVSSNPSGRTDEDPTNDTLRTSFQYYDTVSAVSESFERTLFPPEGWDIVNSDLSTTWQRVTGIAKTGNASVKINNFDYEEVGQQDDLRLPTVNIPATTDSAFFSFQVAAGVYTATTTAGNVWDTLQVLVSTDCGATYTSLYKKWAGTLVTRTAATTSAFVPASSEWRKDSINLADYIGQGNLLIAIRNSTGFENNIYLDDINLRTVTINPNLKAQGFLVTPNPTSGAIAVQFYPQPTNLRAIQIFNLLGQKVAELAVSGNNISNYYTFDLTRQAAGLYTVRAVFTDKMLMKKIVKQ